MQLISLLTDFGASDWFVGAMKGVIAGIAPRATVIDITHAVPPGDIRAGAFAAMAGCRFFPKGTVHVVVVDPGVGGGRSALAVRTANYFFVAPDNGVLSLALRREKIKSVRRLENENFFRRPVSRTFHGRDVFAPVAAHLSCGVPVQKLGPAQNDFVRLPWPEPRLAGGRLEGEVVYLDRFGNAITNLAAADLERLSGAASAVFAGRRRLCALAPCYSTVPAGEPVAVLGSTGFLEIAIHGGSAAKVLRLRVGSALRVAAVA